MTKFIITGPNGEIPIDAKSLDEARAKALKIFNVEIVEEKRLYEVNISSRKVAKFRLEAKNSTIAKEMAIEMGEKDQIKWDEVKVGHVSQVKLIKKPVDITQELE